MNDEVGANFIITESFGSPHGCRIQTKSKTEHMYFDFVRIAAFGLSVLKSRSLMKHTLREAFCPGRLFVVVVRKEENLRSAPFFVLLNCRLEDPTRYCIGVWQWCIVFKRGW